MDDKGISRPHFEDAGRGDGLETPLEELYARELARELEQLLQEEANALRRFDNRELLTIVHQKESVIQELTGRLKDLEKAKINRPEMSREPGYIALKACLKEIEKLNRSNQAFIEGSLSHCRQFIDCLCPSLYHRRRPGVPEHNLAALKGMSFKKEI